MKGFMLRLLDKFSNLSFGKELKGTYDIRLLTNIGLLPV